MLDYRRVPHICSKPHASSDHPLRPVCKVGPQVHQSFRFSWRVILMWNNPSKIWVPSSLYFYMKHFKTNLAMLKAKPIFSVVIFARSRGQDAPETQKEKPLRNRQARSNLFTQTDADKMIHLTSPFKGLLMKKSLESVGSNGAGGNEPETHHLFPLTT